MAYILFSSIILPAGVRLYTVFGFRGTALFCDVVCLTLCCRSDTLGHILPTLGKDWTHQGIARLYHRVSLWVLLIVLQLKYNIFGWSTMLCFCLSYFLLFVTEMDINSCTVLQGPLAWLTWQEVTSTGSMKGEPCCQWAQCCSAQAVFFLPCTGQIYSKG